MDEISALSFKLGVNWQSSLWVRNCDRLGGGVNLPFSWTSTASLWPTFSEMDNNSREDIVELRASWAILTEHPSCGYAHSFSKSLGTIIHITGGRGWFLSGISCLNNTSIVIFCYSVSREVWRQSKNISRLSKIYFSWAPWPSQRNGVEVEFILLGQKNIQNVVGASGLSLYIMYVHAQACSSNDKGRTVLFLPCFSVTASGWQWAIVFSWRKKKSNNLQLQLKALKNKMDMCSGLFYKHQRFSQLHYNLIITNMMQ